MGWVEAGVMAARSSGFGLGQVISYMVASLAVGLTVHYAFARRRLRIWLKAAQGAARGGFVGADHRDRYIVGFIESGQGLVSQTRLSASAADVLAREESRSGREMYASLTSSDGQVLSTRVYLRGRVSREA
ncbi:hypothetical protein [Streptosporangium carneum]|uniref:Uncharacterized protein n=1 Tax=Streptosporangium carneum TaxID=47481 RepID=A0A9W6MC10_9ACTN|nr:hypothetical protein [Streptosporangium carneum]GLK08681.1 hypothetical protein GCM10017600_20860 [Streptosporangium carneum]